MTKKALAQNGTGDNHSLRCAIYARVSTEEQAKEGVSIEAQVSALRIWTKVRGWQSAGEYIDAGYTGGDDKRPELQRLMLDARRGAFEVVAIAKIDRFMRSLRLLKNYLHDLEGLGINFVAIHEVIDTSQGGAGRLLLNILASFAEFERERIGERVRDTRGKLIEDGRWPAGRVIYGYRWNVESYRFEVIEKEAEVVRLIFDLYVNRNVGMVQIAETLNREGYRTRPGRTGKDKEVRPRFWHVGPVNRILRERRYTGQDGHFSYPQIVEEPIFLSAQRKLAEARRVQRHPGRWLLQGWCTCGKCGHRMVTRQKNKESSRKYECLGTMKRAHLDGSPRCAMKSIAAEPLEMMVWHRFTEVASNGELLKQAVDRALEELEQRRKGLGDDTGLEKELEQVRSRKERLWDAYEVGGMPKDTFLAKVSELDQKARRLEARRDGLDPAARLEMARLEAFVTEARRILASGSIVIRDDGLWACASEGNIHEEFHLGTSALQPSRPAMKLRLRTVEGVNPPFDLKVTQHFREGAASQLASMRRLLETFQVRVMAFPDRIEVRGFLPMQVIDRIGDQVSCSACKLRLGWYYVETPCRE